MLRGETLTLGYGMCEDKKGSQSWVSFAGVSCKPAGKNPFKYLLDRQGGTVLLCDLRCEKSWKPLNISWQKLNLSVMETRGFGALVAVMLTMVWDQTDLHYCWSRRITQDGLLQCLKTTGLLNTSICHAIATPMWQSCHLIDSKETMEKRGWCGPHWESKRLYGRFFSARPKKDQLRHVLAICPIPQHCPANLCSTLPHLWARFYLLLVGIYAPTGTHRKTLTFLPVHLIFTLSKSALWCFCGSTKPRQTSRTCFLLPCLSTFKLTS